MAEVPKKDAQEKVPMATIEEVLQAEASELQNMRSRPEGSRRLKDKTAGLAFSGGGIRSATFHLGVLQTLAEYGLLRQFDYLSTVSGGGYIGSWLARWIQQEDIDKVEKALPGELQEPPEVNFLRDYSNFLTPRKGLLGADTWAAIASYLRNLLLNQAILVSFLGAMLLFPWALGRAFAFGSYAGMVTLVLGSVAGGLIALAVGMGVLNTSTCRGGEQKTSTQQKWVLLTVVLPLFAGAFLLNYSIWRTPTLWTAAFSAGAGAGVYVLGHLLGWGMAKMARRQEPKSVPPFANVLWALPAGVFAGYEVHGLSQLALYWNAIPSERGLWHAASWGTPLMVMAFLLAGTLHTGLAKFSLSFEIHEWWARLGGWLMLWSLFWSALFGVAIFAPWGVEKIEGYIWTKRVALLAWAVHSGYGALLGWSKRTGGTNHEESGKRNRLREVVARTAPFVFAAGLLVLVSCGVQELVEAGQARGTTASGYWEITAALESRWLWRTFFLLLGFSIFLSWRVDINRFSMNLLYRNRIVRCYLGASNANRREQPFTGFDPADDVDLKTFAQGYGKYSGPYPILNSTMTVTHGQRLAWQERKAESFIFTPRFCGYDFPEMRPENNKSSGAMEGAYQPTETWAFREGITLGSAVAVSGAAVNPNSGYHTFGPLAFLMTVFNVRLGVWLANPRFKNQDFWERRQRPQGGPALSLLYLLNELVGTATDRSKYVNLSDGAHFENLAIYELVRRECDFIVAGDAGEDPELGFGDLVNAIRKCRTDLGAEIQLDLKPFRITGPEGWATAHFQFGTIQYADGKVGKILYLKSSLTKADPEDVQAYKRAHTSFPHQSTADQFFDESQFESYRMLGRGSMSSAIQEAGEKEVRRGGLAGLFST